MNSVFRARSISLAGFAAVCISACGGGSSPPPPAGPQITSFTATAAEHFVGESAVLVPLFSGGTGRIDPGARSVSSGQSFETGRLAESTAFRLTVTGASTSVTRELPIEVRYRNRFRQLAMPFAREGHVTVELHDGRVLVIGGSNASGGTLPTTNYAFDPSTEVFEEFGALIDPRYDHVALVLQNGNVLVTGGDVQNTNTRESEILDARTGVAFTTGAPARNRLDAAAVLLRDGQVLITGGFALPPLRTAEIYNPGTGQFTTTSGMLSRGRYAHSATLLADGRVLIYGGLTAGASAVPPEVYDPTTEMFSPLQPPETVTRSSHVALVLVSGKVGIFGGEDAQIAPIRESFAFAASPDQFEPLAELAQGRTVAAGARLIDGRVLLTGGFVSTTSEAQASTEIVSAVGDASSAGPAMSVPRAFHTANKLRTGKVLIVGGLDAGRVPLATAELFE